MTAASEDAAVILLINGYADNTAIGLTVNGNTYSRFSCLNTGHNTVFNCANTAVSTDKGHIFNLFAIIGDQIKAEGLPNSNCNICITDIIVEHSRFSRLVGVNAWHNRFKRAANNTAQFDVCIFSIYCCLNK